MVQKVSCSDSSSQNSLSPRGDWLETRGEALRPPTAVFLDDVGAPARGSTRRPRCWFSAGRSSFGGCRRAPTATSRLRPGPRGSGVWWCITPGQDVLDRLSLLLHCWELPGKALDSVAEQPSLGDGSVEKACFVACSARLSQRWRSWTTRLHPLPEGEVSRRTQLLHQPWVGTTLVHLFQCLGLVNLQDSMTCRAEADRDTTVRTVPPTRTVSRDEWLCGDQHVHSSE